VGLLDITVTLGVDGGAQLAEQLIQADQVDADLPLALLGLYTVGAPLPVAELVDVSWDGLDERWPDMMARLEIGPSWRATLSDLFAEMMGRLADLGVVQLDDEQVQLTPLGRWGLHRQLRQAGFTAPVVGELAGADADTLLAAAADWDVDVANLELAGWVAVRTPESAVAELAAAVRGADSPRVRMLGFSAFDQLTEHAEPLGGSWSATR